MGYVIYITYPAFFLRINPSMSDEKFHQKIEALKALFPFIVSLSVLVSGISAFFYILIFQDKLFIAIVSAVGTLFVQRYLEEYRNTKKQAELARLLIDRIRRHYPVLLVIRRILFSQNNSEAIKVLQITQWLSQLRDDESFYKELFRQSGAFPLDVLKYVSNYLDNMRTAINLLELSIKDENIENLNNIRNLESLAVHLISCATDGALCSLILEKQTLKDDVEFQRDKFLLINEYKECRKAIQAGEITGGAKDFLSNGLESIENVFEQLNISTELHESRGSEDIIC